MVRVKSARRGADVLYPTDRSEYSMLTGYAGASLLT